MGILLRQSKVIPGRLLPSSNPNLLFFGRSTLLHPRTGILGVTGKTGAREVQMSPLAREGRIAGRGFSERENDVTCTHIYFVRSVQQRCGLKTSPALS
jgi:hypothetical protein